MILRSLPESELLSLIARMGIRIDAGKRIDAPSQAARALVGIPDVRDTSRLSAGSRELLHRIAEAGGALQVPSLPAGLEPLLGRGVVFGRKVEHGFELVLPTAFLVQLKSWESEDPRALRALLAQAPFETMSAIATHYLGRPATPPIALSLEPAWEILSDPERLREELDKLPPVERRLLENIESGGGEVDTQELLDLEREPLRLRGAGGVTATRRGAGFSLERRAFLIPIHPNRHVIPTEVAQIVGADRRQAREERRAQIRTFVLEEDHAPRRARFASDPAFLAVAMAFAVREPGNEVRPGVGTPRSLLVKFSQRFGRDVEAIALIAALSRAVGLWDASAAAPATPPGSLAMYELTQLLFTTWRRGGAWDEARPEREVLRVAEGSRDASPIGALREMVIDALQDLGEGRWVPWHSLEGYLAADERIAGIERLLRRWSERAGVEAPDVHATTRRIALETLPTLGIIDLGGRIDAASPRAPWPRRSPPGAPPSASPRGAAPSSPAPSPPSTPPPASSSTPTPCAWASPPRSPTSSPSPSSPSSAASAISSTCSSPPRPWPAPSPPESRATRSAPASSWWPRSPTPSPACSSRPAPSSAAALWWGPPPSSGSTTSRCASCSARAAPPASCSWIRPRPGACSSTPTRTSSASCAAAAPSASRSRSTRASRRRPRPSHTTPPPGRVAAARPGSTPPPKPGSSPVRPPPGSPRHARRGHQARPKIASFSLAQTSPPRPPLPGPARSSKERRAGDAGPERGGRGRRFPSPLCLARHPEQPACGLERAEAGRGGWGVRSAGKSGTTRMPRTYAPVPCWTAGLRRPLAFSRDRAKRIVGWKGAGVWCPAMEQTQLRNFGVRRVYETSKGDGDAVALRLRDRVVELGPKEHDAYTKLVEWIPTTKPVGDLVAAAGMDEKRLERFAAALADTGLLYRRQDIPATITGKQFFKDYFSPSLDSWLDEAFSHPFWEKMVSGKGSARLHTGWTFELYHYTKNCNRHMPLSGSTPATRPSSCSTPSTTPRSGTTTTTSPSRCGRSATPTSRSRARCPSP